jgi:hypothetical protein
MRHAILKSLTYAVALTALSISSSTDARTKVTSVFDLAKQLKARKLYPQLHALTGKLSELEQKLSSMA